MSVAFVCDGYRTSYGGNFIPSLMHLADELNNQGIKTVWIFHESVSERAWYEMLLNKGYTVELINFNDNLIHRTCAIKKLIKKYDIKLLHIHFGDKLAATAAAYFNKKIKIVWHIHSDWSLGETHKLSLKDKLKNMCKAVLSKRINQIFVNDNLGGPNAKVVKNGIAVERITHLSENEKLSLREELGIGENEKIILMFGWDYMVKGVDIAVKAVKKLNETNKDIKLAVVVGEKINIKATVENLLGEDECVYYLPRRQDVFDYYSICDVFLSASRSEGFPYSVCEAIEAGKACVVSDIPGCNWAKEFTSVTFFESKNTKECANAIEHSLALSEDENYLDLLATDSINCQKKYNADIWAKDVIAAYRSFGFGK